MKNLFTFALGLVIVIMLVIYMVSFQVRYDEVAVVTTFDKDTPPQYIKEGTEIDPEHPGSLKRDPGFYLKMPWPIQKVTTYPKRLLVLDDQPEEQQTLDNYAVVVHTYLTWRIQDPHAFFVTLQNPEEARKQLHSLLRGVTSVIGRYKFSEMVNSDARQLKLAQIEEEALTRLRERLATMNPKYGITVEHLGIRRIALPEATTSKVFDRMKATRERLAADARSTGEARAAAIKSEAISAQKTILSFADRRAQAIRAEGDREAAKYYSTFSQDEEFAIFLRNMDAMKKIFKNNTTFVLNADAVNSPVGSLVKDPSALADKDKK